jgi:hypothetical protein
MGRRWGWGLGDGLTIEAMATTEVGCSGSKATVGAMGTT